MQATKSIKLHITNNQIHQSFSKQDIIDPLESKTDCEYIEFQDIQFEGWNDEKEDEKKLKQGVKFMFTIREEESYEYEEDDGSDCKRLTSCESILAELSSIKVDKGKEDSFECHNKLVIAFQNAGGKQINDIETMNSTSDKQLINLPPLIQSWDQKLKKQPQPIRPQQKDQPIKEEEMFVLKPSQRKLYLNKAKINLHAIFQLKYQKLHNQICDSSHLQNKKLRLTLVKNLVDQKQNIGIIRNPIMRVGKVG